MTARDVGELVHSYVEHNDHQRAKKTLHFRLRLDYPGPDWIKQFMKKKDLYAKQATTLNSARCNATKIYDLFISMIYWKKTINSFMTEAVII